MNQPALKRYTIAFTLSEYYTADVVAESEEEAMQIWNSGDKDRRGSDPHTCPKWQGAEGASEDEIIEVRDYEAGPQPYRERRR